jgi:hypothetical protein
MRQLQVKMSELLFRMVNGFFESFLCFARGKNLGNALSLNQVMGAYLVYINGSLTWYWNDTEQVGKKLDF